MNLASHALALTLALAVSVNTFSKGATEAKPADTACRAAAYGLFMRGVEEEMKNRPHQALEFYREAAALDSESAFLRRKIGEMLFHAGNFQEALTAIQQSLAVEETRDAHILAGRLYRAMAQQSPRHEKALTEQAARHMLRAVEMAGEVGLAGLELASLYASLDRLDEAEALLRRVMDENAGDDAPYVMLARIRAVRGEHEEARALLERAVEIDPASPEAALALAAHYQESEDCDRAVPLLERLLEGMPLHFEVRERLGWCYALQERYALAVSLLEPVVRVRPAFQTVFTLALAYRELKEFDKAQALWLWFLRENPFHVRAREALAGVYAAMGDYGAALDQYRVIEADLLKQARKDAGARETLAHVARAQGILLLELKRPEDAAAALERAIQLGGAAAEEEMYGLAVTAWIQARNATRALASVTEGLSRHPQSMTLRFALAEIYAFDGKREHALAEIARLLAANNRLTERDYLHAAGFLSRLGESARAIETLREAERLFPESDRVQFQLGAVHERAGEFDAAVKHLNRAVEINPLNAPALNYLGYMLADKGVRLDEALSLVERAVALDSRNGAYLDSLGWAHFRLGNYEKAERYLKDAAERLEDPVVRDHLGDLYFALGRYEKAMMEWRKAIEIGAENPKAIEEKIHKAESHLQGKEP